MSIYLHEQILFNHKFYPEALKLHHNKNCNKTENNANITIFISITTLIPLWYPEIHPFWPFFPPFFTIESSFTNTILLKTAQNRDSPQHVVLLLSAFISSPPSHYPIVSNPLPAISLCLQWAQPQALFQSFQILSGPSVFCVIFERSYFSTRGSEVTLFVSNVSL